MRLAAGVDGVLLARRSATLRRVSAALTHLAGAEVRRGSKPASTDRGFDLTRRALRPGDAVSIAGLDGVVVDMSKMRNACVAQEEGVRRLHPQGWRLRRRRR
jgi:hypothetical protein